MTLYFDRNRNKAIAKVDIFLYRYHMFDDASYSDSNEFLVVPDKDSMLTHP